MTNTVYFIGAFVLVPFLVNAVIFTCYRRIQRREASEMRLRANVLSADLERAGKAMLVAMRAFDHEKAIYEREYDQFKLTCRDTMASILEKQYSADKVIAVRMAKAEERMEASEPAHKNVVSIEARDRLCAFLRKNGMNLRGDEGVSSLITCMLLVARKHDMVVSTFIPKSHNVN